MSDDLTPTLLTVHDKVVALSQAVRRPAPLPAESGKVPATVSGFEQGPDGHFARLLVLKHTKASPEEAKKGKLPPTAHFTFLYPVPEQKAKRPKKRQSITIDLDA